MDGKIRKTNGEYVVVNSEYQWRRGSVEVMCCGCWMFCNNFTNTCPSCYADYNMSGQQLAPRSQWGEETGEYVEDILAVDTDMSFDGED